MNLKANFDFSNKVALVTGAASGIGHSTALAFAQAGARVVVGDLQSDAGLRTVHEIEKAGGQALFVKCDVSNENDVKQLIEEAVRTYGRLDFAFNNAGIEGEQAPSAEMSTANWDHVMNINLKGVWLCMKYELRQMLKQNSGAIVNCSSVAGLVGFANIAAYTASKHGVLGLTKAAALEYAKSGIRVNAVCPGVIETPMIDRFAHGDKKVEAQLSAGEPVGRMGLPEEIAAAVLWLSSPAASFVTGHPLAVDGGWVTQ